MINGFAGESSPVEKSRYRSGEFILLAAPHLEDGLANELILVMQRKPYKVIQKNESEMQKVPVAKP